MANSATVVFTVDKTAQDLSDVLVNTDPSLMMSNLQNFLLAVQAGYSAASMTVKINDGNAEYASGDVVISDVFSGDALLINGVSFEANDDFPIHGSDEATAENLAIAINESTNPLISGVVTASAFEDVVTVTSVLPGVTGNLVTLEGKGSGGIDPEGSGVSATGQLTVSSIAAGDTAVVNGITLTGEYAYEQTTITATSEDANTTLNDKYFEFSAMSSEDTEEDFYVWFNVDDGGTDPELEGKTGIEVVLAGEESAGDVASAVRSALASHYFPMFDLFYIGGDGSDIIINNLLSGNSTDASDTGSTDFTIVKNHDGKILDSDEFSIDHSDVNAASQLANKINITESLSSLVHGSADVGVVTINATTEGKEGNSITLAGTGGISASGDRLEGGEDSAVVRLSGGSSGSDAASYSFYR